MYRVIRLYIIVLFVIFHIKIIRHSFRPDICICCHRKNIMGQQCHMLMTVLIFMGNKLYIVDITIVTSETTCKLAYELYILQDTVLQIVHIPC